MERLTDELVIKLGFIQTNAGTMWYKQGNNSSGMVFSRLSWNEWAKYGMVTVDDLALQYWIVAGERLLNTQS